MPHVRANGIDVVFRLDGPVGAETIVLGNGFATDLSMWEPQVEALAATYRVLRYDHRGHGGSSSTSGDYSLDLLSDDAAALMDALGVRHAHLLGTSLGAMIWQHFGLTRPDRTLSLVLCATTTHPPQQAWDTRITAARRIGIAPQAESIVERWVTPDVRDTRPEVVRRLRDMVVGTSVDGFVGCAAAIRDMTLADRIGAIRAPTLVVAGDDDLATPLPDLDFIAGAIPGARLVRIAQAAHMPTIERPADCNAAILTFLDRVASARDVAETGILAS